MMVHYTISIDNQSSRTQDYGIFTQAPTITRSTPLPLTVTSRIILSARGVSSNQGQATFILSKNLYAMCGISDIEPTRTRDRLGTSFVGTGVEVIDQRAVVLGGIGDNGKRVLGTTLRITCANDALSFVDKALDPEGESGCFSIRTQNDFTHKEAKHNKFVVGFSSSLRQSVGPYATFVPEPGEIYQVCPSTIFYIVQGRFNARDPIPKNLESAPSTCRVDFKELQTDTVSVVHDEHGKLSIQVSEMDQIGMWTDTQDTYISEGLEGLFISPESSERGSMLTLASADDVSALSSWG